MRVVIAGGTGLIGRPLAASLAADGHQVAVLSRSPELAPPFPGGVRVVRWDAHTRRGWVHLADGAKAIVNLAGASLNRRWTRRNRELIEQSRLNAGKAVVDAVREARRKPDVVIQASGAGCYGPRGDEIITEEAGFGDGFLGRTAAAWEASTVAVEERGVRRAIIRTGVVLSNEGGALPLLVLPFRFYIGGPLGSGRQWLPWIHEDDQVRAIRWLIEKDDGAGPFNLSAPNPVTNAEFSRLLGRITERPAVVRAPAFALRLALGKMSTVVLEGQCALPQRLSEMGFKFCFSQAEAALRDLL